MDLIKNFYSHPKYYGKTRCDLHPRVDFERKKIYSEADHRIKCQSLTSEEIAKKVIFLYEKSGN